MAGAEALRHDDLGACQLGWYGVEVPPPGDQRLSGHDPFFADGGRERCARYRRQWFAFSDREHVGSAIDV
jgi:hypothetical protein